MNKKLDNIDIETWYKIIDEPNLKFINFYNKLKELQKDNNTEELLKIFKLLWGFYSLNAKKRLEFMRVHQYQNTAFIEKLYKIQLRVLERLYISISWWHHVFTNEDLVSVEEVIINNIWWDKHCISFIKKKYWKEVDDILAKMHPQEMRE